MEVLVQPLQRVLNVQPGANLLEVLRSNEVPVSYSCMAGRCGTCRCRVLSGAVLDGGALLQRPSAEDRFVLACQAVLTGPCTIEVPEVDEVVVHPARVLKASVVSIEQLTHDIQRLRLKPNKPLDFSPGQYAMLQFTPAHVRPYSMAGLPGDALLEFHLRRVPEGRVTGYVATELKLGDSVRVSGPMGTAYLRKKHEGPLLCVAGGTGLAPILSIIRGAVQAGMSNPIHLYVGVRTPRDVYGLAELHALREQHPTLQIHVVATSGAGQGMRSGLVTDAIAADWTDFSGFKAYLCGAPPMVEAVSLLVRQRGLDAAHICADAFYSSAD